MTRLFRLLAAAVLMVVPIIALAGKQIDNRAVVTDFVNRFYTKRDVAGAFAAHVAPGYIQHNPGLSDGASAAVNALAPMFALPGARFEVRQVLVDGDLALVHLFGQGKLAAPGAAVADLYRLKDGKVVEHWDVIQPVEPGTDPLAMAAAPARPEDTATNRRIFMKFVDLMLYRKQPARAYDLYAAPDMIQHNARVGKDRAQTVKAIMPMFASPASSFEVQRVLVDGNLAAVHYRGKLNFDERGAAVVEIFRFEKGRIVEHWDMFQPVPATSSNDHPMF